MAESSQTHEMPLLTEEERHALEAYGRARRRPAGTTLFTEGEEADSALLIRNGHVKIVAGQPPRIVAIRSPGEFVGEMAVLQEAPRSATAIAFDDLEALELAASEWLRFLYDHPRAMHALLRETVQRFEQATRKITESDLAVEQRLAKAFMELIEAGVSEQTADGVVLELSQLDLASWIGASVDSVKKAIGRFKKAGLVSTGRKVTTLLNPAVIRDIANGTVTASAWSEQRARDAGSPV
jgi:CRP/FNR family cyclic AMP-dependent transcriptional regulator